MSSFMNVSSFFSYSMRVHRQADSASSAGLTPSPILRNLLNRGPCCCVDPLDVEPAGALGPLDDDDEDLPFPFGWNLLLNGAELLEPLEGNRLPGLFPFPFPLPFLLPFAPGVLDLGLFPLPFPFPFPFGRPSRSPMPLVSAIAKIG